MEKTLTRLDVKLCFEDRLRGSCTVTIEASLNEALTLLSMPCLSGFIVSVVPNYELSEMSEE